MERSSHKPVTVASPALNGTIGVAVLFGVLLLFVAACGESADGTDSADSAQAEATVSQWSVEPVPRTRLTQQDTVAFEGVQGVTVLPDGGVVVASYVANTLRYFAADGTFEKSVGREGKGPGEFRTIGVFSRYGDTIVAMDLDEVSQHFTLDGRYVRTDARPIGGGRLLGYFGNGDRLVGRFQLDSVRAGTTQQVPELLVRVRETNEQTLGRFPSRVLTRDQDGKLSARIYGAENRVAMFVDGFCAGYGGAATITCHDAAGALQQTITLTRSTPVPVSNADRESYFDEFRLANSNAPKVQLDEEIARMRERLGFAEVLGIFGPLRSGRDGLLWVGPPGIDAWRYADPNPLPAEPTVWSVYTRTGEWVADATLPARFFLWEAGDDYVVGVTRDEDDAEMVVVYSLRK